MPSIVTPASDAAIVAEPEQQDGVGDDVDFSRHAAAVQMDQIGDVSRELERCADGRSPQPMIDVRGRLHRVERAQVIAHGYALAELFERWLEQLLTEVGLTDEHDLDEL